MDIQDCERGNGYYKTYGALRQGRKSGEEEGWISSDEAAHEKRRGQRFSTLVTVAN